MKNITISFDPTSLGWIALVILIIIGLIKFFGKTFITEAIKGSFAEDLAKLQSDLNLEVQNKVQPLIAGFNILANREDVIFNLEKESIVEFNEAINSWLWKDMGIKMDETDLNDSNKLRERINKADDSYHRSKIYLSKMDLIVEYPELITAANKALIMCLNCKHFIDKIYLQIARNLNQMNPLQEKFFKGMDTPNWFNDPIMKQMTINISEHRTVIQTLQQKYRDEINIHYLPAVNEVNAFIQLAKQFLKDNKKPSL
jgi:hypothetical protein